MPTRPTYIVTGGAGFVGSNLVAALLARRPRPAIVVVDSFRSGSFANITEACERRGVGPFDGEVIPGSTADEDIQQEMLRRQADALFHLGAITDTTLSGEAEMIRENVGGMLAMMRGHPRDPPRLRLQRRDVRLAPADPRPRPLPARGRGPSEQRLRLQQMAPGVRAPPLRR